MPPSALFSPINWCQEAGVTFTFGDWSTSLPLTNLLTTDVLQYARSADATLTATQFRVDFGSSRRINSFGVLGLNVSTAALIRARAAVDAPPSIETDFTGSTLGPFAFARSSTATYFDASGVLQVAGSGVPRYDHDPATGAELGILVEAEARENLIAHSNNLAGWASGSNATITANAGTAMDGTTTADRVTATAGGGNGRVVASVSYAADTQYVWSLVLKSEVGTSVAMVLVRAEMGNPEIQIDLSTGTVINSAGSALNAFGIIPMGGGRYRCWMGVTTDGAAGSIQTELRLFNNADQVLVSDAQLEICNNLIWPSSLIPTSGSTVTRAAETVALTGTDFTDRWQSGAGSAAIEFSLPVEPHTGFGSIMSLFRFQGSGSRAIALRVSDVGSDDINLFIHDGSAQQVGATVSTTVAYGGTVNRAAAAWDTNDAIACHAGSLSAQDTSVTLPTLNQLGLSGTAANSGPLHIRWFAYWSRRLADADLQAGTLDRDDFPGWTDITDGWVSAYPTTHVPSGGYIPFGRASADGKLPADERPPEGTSFFAFPATAVDGRYVSVEINDTANPDGFVQASHLWLGYGERSANGVPVGEMTFAVAEEARKRRSLAGTPLVRSVWKKRRFVGAIRYEDATPSLRTWRDMAERVGGTMPVLVSFDFSGDGSGAGVDLTRLTMIGLMDEPTPIENATWGHYGFAFALTAL